MSKFDIGDRVQVKGEPTDWDIGTVTGCRSSFGEPYCDVTWDSSPWSTHDEDDLFLVCAVADRPKIVKPLAEWERELLGYPKHAATPKPDLDDIAESGLTPHEAVNLASKLLQFATQEGTK